MNKTKNILQQENDNRFWRQLLNELSEMYEGKLEIIFPKELNQHYFSWFHKMEKAGFRQELRYTFEQLAKMLEKPELLLWFVTVDDVPQILLFGYSMTDNNEKSFYLDTFAVIPRGVGIGNIVIEFLIRWAKTKKYHSIVLDTELRDEKGIPLQQFYGKHGFETVFSSKKGDLIMKRVL